MKFYQWNLQMINLIKISLMLLAQPAGRKKNDLQC